MIISSCLYIRLNSYVITRNIIIYSSVREDFTAALWLCCGGTEHIQTYHTAQLQGLYFMARLAVKQLGTVQTGQIAERAFLQLGNAVAQLVDGLIEQGFIELTSGDNVRNLCMCITAKIIAFHKGFLQLF